MATPGIQEISARAIHQPMTSALSGYLYEPYDDGLKSINVNNRID